MRNILLVVTLIVLLPALTAAQGNAFNFQGRLNDGANPANGSYDLQFSLYGSITGGTPFGSTLQRPNTTLINGVFSVTLDFGATAFNSPNAVFIEIGVKPNGSANAFTILGPRQQLTAVPFAVRAANATNADNATNTQNAVNAINATTATNATNATNATTANNALSLGGVPAANFVRLDINNPGDLRMSGGLLINENARQNSAFGGLVKAMIFVNGDGTILRCYNGVTGSSTGNCGFEIVVLNPIPQYNIDFNFRIDSRFISITPLVRFEPKGTTAPAITSNFFFSQFDLADIIVENKITNAATGSNVTRNPFMVFVY